MSRNLFVIGTGTDVGKTYVTGLLLKKLHAAGISCAYYKAAMSGNLRRPDGSLIPGDARFVADLSGIDQPLATMCPYVYETAVSPHLASKLEGGAVEWETVRKGFLSLSQQYDLVTMEGSGGILCPLRWDTETLLLEDVILRLELPVLLVADAGLGTINSVVLTCEYLKHQKIPIAGILFNRYDADSVMHRDNLRMCETLTGLRVLGTVGEHANDIDISAAELEKLYR